MSVPLPRVILLPLGLNVKFVAVKSSALNVNPPIVPEVAFSTPAFVTLNSAFPNVSFPI